MSDSRVRVKICGLTRPRDMDVVAAAGAAYAGLVFFARSPRALAIPQAKAIALAAPAGLARVGLFVDAEDALIDAVLAEVPLDMVQLHGRETPERLAALRTRHGLPLIKAVGVAGAEDLPKLVDYGRVADMLLVDAKPPRDAVLPGGNGLAFDWRLLAGQTIAVRIAGSRRYAAGSPIRLSFDMGLASLFDAGTELRI